MLIRRGKFLASCCQVVAIRIDMELDTVRGGSRSNVTVCARMDIRTDGPKNVHLELTC